MSDSGGDSLLLGTQDPICQPDLLSGEVSCLLGAQIWDVEKLLRLVHPSDYYPLLLFNMGTNETTGEIWSTSQMTT